MRDLFRYLLPSGTGVTITELRPSEKDAVTKNAAKLIGKDGSVADFRVTEVHEGVCKMLKQVSKKKFSKSEDLIASKDTDWKDVDSSDLDENYDEYFTAKDDSVLASIYRKLHEVNLDEVEQIAGKAITVSA